MQHTALQRKKTRTVTRCYRCLRQTALQKRRHPKRNMNSSLKRIWNIISSVLVGLVVLLAIALAGVRLVGLQPYMVLSGSMEPTYPVGSLLYVRAVDYKTLAVGDPVTCMIDEHTVATHRIVEILPDAQDPNTLRFRLKGDANATADGDPVHYKNIIGKPVFSVPLLGYVADYIQHPPGVYVAVAAGAVLILLAFLPDLLFEKKAVCRKDDLEK